MKEPSDTLMSKMCLDQKEAIFRFLQEDNKGNHLNINILKFKIKVKVDLAGAFPLFLMIDPYRLLCVQFGLSYWLLYQSYIYSFDKFVK